MPSKILSNTDINKGAIFVTQEISDLLHSLGIEPTIRGDSLHEIVINIWFENRNENILMHYYGAERAGSGRDPEERCWHESFRGIAAPDKIFDISYNNKKLVLRIG